MLKAILRASLGVVVVLAIGEVAVRGIGLSDVPLYVDRGDSGYWIKPSQQGSFMHRNEWAFNDLGMPIERDYQPTDAIDVPVIGNSIIMGGNSYKQRDKVAPLMQKALGAEFNIWPVAVGGWTNVNEAEFLQKHPQIAANADMFVWEVMDGGFSQLSQWRGEYVFPTKRPVSALWYAIRRYVLPRFVHFNMNELPPDGTATPENLAMVEGQIKLLSQKNGLRHPGILFLYPSRDQLALAKTGKEWLPERQAIERIAVKYRLLIVDLSQHEGWTPSLYREGVHPNESGNAFIARVLSDALLSARDMNTVHSHAPAADGAFAAALPQYAKSNDQ